MGATKAEQLLLEQMLMGTGSSNGISQNQAAGQKLRPGKVSTGAVSAKKKKSFESLKTAITDLESMLRSDSSDVQLEATKNFRQLLSVERDTLVQDVLDRDIVPQLLNFLRNKDNPALQVEALWALTNIAAGTTEHTHLLIKNNAVPTLVSLLDSTHQEVLQQAVWVLGNIAGDGTAARDKVLGAGVLEPLLNCMQDLSKVGLLRIATWTLSNLCDGQPRPVFKVHAVLQTMRHVLQVEDTEVLSHACWALSHLCDGASPHIQAVVEADVCPRLVALLHSKSWRVVKPALRTVGNIVCAEDEQDYTQQIIECGAVPCLRELITHSVREIQKEACWTLSNIAAGTVPQIQCVLDSGSIPTLVKLASKDSNTDPDVKIEACWVLLNATSCGSDSQIEALVAEGCVSVLCSLLNDNSMVMMALEGLEKILQVGQGIGERGPEPLTNPHASLLDTEKIEALQSHRTSAIAKRATRMWDNFFVICAICKKAYSRLSSATNFCTECKCNVCTNCDCTVFHLSYQDKLWQELAEGEAKNERGKQQSKKSKRKKNKKNRNKDTQKQKDKQKAASEAKPAKPAEAEDESNKTKSSDNDAKTNDQAKQPDQVQDQAQDQAQDQDQAQAQDPKHDATQDPQGQAPTPPAEEKGQAVTTQAKAAGAAPAAPDKDPSPAPATTEDKDILTAHNDVYVDFLSNTGSILDLWKMINESEGAEGLDNDAASASDRDRTDEETELPVAAPASSTSAAK
ncbi:Importin subunit alpha-1 (IMPa-1) (Karyopherin subunit alpha-1) (KAP-alpha-1) [Durusdinium trenchii]|uniref:Importin subunit alpha-1 (IMPa-1) (Karyopherin subunit alpha-1) (KAP-alpha-1) n=1 Tax=Durusdinium trenchii TaxID=1381693 RepID=A0ABP0LPI8_9DINO